MAIKLFAHILRGSSPSAGDAGMVEPAQALDFGRWVLGELVVMRNEGALWGLSRPLPRRPATKRRDAAPGEPTWADTQPWCHE